MNASDVWTLLNDTRDDMDQRLSDAGAGIVNLERGFRHEESKRAVIAQIDKCMALLAMVKRQVEKL